MSNKHNVWMSVSDLMTGLMIIFLFIAIAYMIQVQKNQSVLTDYVETKTKLHDKLESEFKDRPEEWQLVIGKDLSMKFNNPEVLFAKGKSDLTETFKGILDEFIPRYLNILLEDTLRFRIKEIRIEGHTDDLKFHGSQNDPYIDNAQLSQERSLSVLKYIRKMPAIQNYKPEQQKMLEYWFTANGLSYGKSLDNNGNYTFISGKSIDRNLSRRVEFRIVTDGDEILEDFVNKNK